MLQLISGQVLAQSSALPVDYYPRRDSDGHFYIMLWVGNKHIGFHAGERSGDMLRFARLSDARRFCTRRNRAEKARVRLLAANVLP